MALRRRDFLTKAGLAGFGIPAGFAAESAPVSIVTDPKDPIASAAPAKWAADELRRALEAQNVTVRSHTRMDQSAPGDRVIVCAGATTPLAREVLQSAGRTVPKTPEALGLMTGKAGGRPVLLACGSDVRGLVYALLEVADRATFGEPGTALDIREPLVDRPANVVRSIARCFVSDVEDKPWYNDRSMWPPYLTMLAAQRFNRFSLTLGIGYDFEVNVTDCYFHFAYPFLVSVPGYDVRAVGLPDAERGQNLEMLRFIGEQTVARGLEFHLGLWTHGYQWRDSPRANYTISGLTPDNHATYCRDALAAVLKACPSISGLTFRVHGESGVAEGSYAFWQTLFEAIVKCGRKVEINMHAKGIDQKMIDVGLATGMPVVVSPKAWAEHMGLPYHQAAIRDLEMPPQGRQDRGFFALSSGSRSFLRYGYGDLLREDRPFGVLHRMWPGTQRVLLWGDPAIAAGYARYGQFCGSQGLEIFEPLSFKGRRGSGVPGGRCSYADAPLNPKYDWEKYLYSYRLWGRSLYEPNMDRQVWRRFLRKQFGPAAAATESALAEAGRILPLVTTTHGPSGANNTYWPEMYTNMPIVDPQRRHPYGDSPSPKRFGTVSPFDPELFARIDDFARELLQGDRSGKYSPIDVARWLENFSAASAKQLAEAQSQAGANAGTEFRRMAIDVAMQSDLGRFYSNKLRSGVLFAIHERSGDRAALEEALKAYRQARAAWAELAIRAKDVYVSDVSYGPERHLRGHWLDRLPAIDADISDMEKRLEQPASTTNAVIDPERLRRAVEEALGQPRRPSLQYNYVRPNNFVPGQPLEMGLMVQGSRSPSARLHYRHVDQAERWRVTPMELKGTRHVAVIPGDYTQSPFPLEFFFELRDGLQAWFYPGFDAFLSNQPYFIVRQPRA